MVAFSAATKDPNLDPNYRLSKQNISFFNSANNGIFTNYDWRGQDYPESSAVLAQHRSSDVYMGMLCSYIYYYNLEQDFN